MNKVIYGIETTTNETVEFTIKNKWYDEHLKIDEFVPKALIKNSKISPKKHLELIKQNNINEIKQRICNNLASKPVIIPENVIDFVNRLTYEHILIIKKNNKTKRIVLKMKKQLESPISVYGYRK